MAVFSTYTPKQWQSKEFIKASDLNHIEQGVGLNNELIEDLIEHGTGVSQDVKDYVNESITQTNAFFRGSFNTKAALLAVQWQTVNSTSLYFVSNNDYAYIAADETHNNEAWRYTYVYEKNGSNNGWQAQYRINESPMTSEQLAAINSGITSAKVATIDNKVDKITGKQLSTNDYTTIEKTKLSGIEENAQVNTITGIKGNAEPNYRTGNVNITKDNIGLNNVDNTADINKPISTAVQAVLDTKENSAQTMTMAQYEALTSAQKMDGTIRFITDANSYPDAGGVGF